MFRRLLTPFLLLLFSAQIYALGGFYVAPTVSLQGYSAKESERNVVQPKVAVGYGQILTSPFYLAGEIFAGTKPITTSSFGVNDETLTPGTTYGFSLIPGWVLDYSTTMLYGRLGYVWSKFPNSSYLKAYQLGAGLQMNIACNWDARLEYIYSKYDELDGIGRPKVDEGSLAFVFTFL